MKILKKGEKRMKGPKKLLALIGTLVLVGAMLVPAAIFAADDTVTGTFSNNNVPSIDYVQLWDTGGTPAEATSMTPQVEYDARVKVTDADGKTDLTTIVVKIWYDSDGGTPTEAEFNALSAGDAQTAIIITWTETGDTYELTEESGSTWSLGTCVTPADLTGYFQFKFTVGKVATECDGTAAKWQIAAKVTDDSSESNTWGATSYDTQGSAIVWYGEITVTATSVDWGTVNPGMDFAEGDPSEELIGNINYISNGDYDEKVKSSTPWSTTANLDATGVCTNANEFALKADDTGTLSSAVLVDTTGVAIDTTGILTEEAGDTVTTNSLWLKLASTFTKATYSGTITYTIANG